MDLGYETIWFSAKLNEKQSKPGISSGLQPVAAASHERWQNDVCAGNGIHSETVPKVHYGFDAPIKVVIEVWPSFGCRIVAGLLGLD